MALEEPQKVSVGASPHCLSWMSKTQSQSRDSARAMAGRKLHATLYSKFFATRFVVIVLCDYQTASSLHLLKR